MEASRLCLLVRRWRSSLDLKSKLAQQMSQEYTSEEEGI